MATLTVSNTDLPRQMSRSVMRPTPIYHASYQQITGLAWHIGPTLLFTPVDEPLVYVIQDPATLRLGPPLPDGMAQFLTTTLIEPRLAEQGGAQ